VCATALRVDDAQRALARAKALLCSEWQEPVGEAERRIPAIRGLDGTLIYLIEPAPSGRTIYDDDFVLTPEAEGEPGLLSVDHIAHAVPDGRMDGFVLFWRAVFGFIPQALWELPDPHGLIRSRAMTSPEGSVHFPLNISVSRDTATGRFISASAGAGVHHIAFATRNIAGVVAATSAEGARMIPIPLNYYEDLAARHGLSNEALTRLAGLHLLYDRDDDGTFVHAYTESFHDRFFFEIVERLGYLGFGAVNASVRMAAQAQRRTAHDMEPRTGIAR
jgi:4-hydroxyphenylpyruvate dioxygenase